MLELVEENGFVGLGEASPLPGFSRESLEEAAEQLASSTSALIGRNLTKDCLYNNEAFSQELNNSGLSPSARFGIELALWNIYAALEGKSLTELLCSSPVGSVPVNGLLNGSVREVLAEGYRMREAGYEAVKLKVGGRSVGEDAELVRSLRGVLGEGVSLRLDANRAWSFVEAASFARAIEGVEYEYMEEPLADPSRFADFAREFGAPVALDESLVGMSPEGLERHGYARAVVIKPTMIGGISQTLRLAEEAHRLGITPVISSAYETGVGAGALLALAAATGGGSVAAGLDTYRRLGADVLHPPLDVTAPRVDLHEATGVDHRLRRNCLRVLHSSES